MYMALELKTSQYALFRHNVLEIVVTRKFPRSLPRCAQYILLLKAFWSKLAALVAMKTKFRSRLDAENDLICALSCIEPRICMFSNTLDVVLLQVVFTSVTWMCNKCRIGGVSRIGGVVSGPQTLRLFVTWSTCLKMLRNPVLCRPKGSDILHNTTMKSKNNCTETNVNGSETVENCWKGKNSIVAHTACWLSDNKWTPNTNSRLQEKSNGNTLRCAKRSLQKNAVPAAPTASIPGQAIGGGKTGARRAVRPVYSSSFVEGDLRLASLASTSRNIAIAGQRPKTTPFRVQTSVTDRSFFTTGVSSSSSLLFSKSWFEISLIKEEEPEQHIASLFAHGTLPVRGLKIFYIVSFKP